MVHTGENKVLSDELQNTDCDISLEQKDKHILLGGQKQDIGAEVSTLTQVEEHGFSAN